MIDLLRSLYHGVFGTIESIASGWFVGLAARLTFASVLLMYFLNSALTKVGSGFPGSLIASTGAYVQILGEKAFEAYSFNVANVPLFPETLIVYAGTYAEFVLPVLIVIGLFTRAASLGMIGFIAVMTIVDINLHTVDAKTIGELFDRVQDSAIADQRLLWMFPLGYLVIKGPGLVSLDALLGGLIRKNEI